MDREKAFIRIIESLNFPCVGAKSAHRQQNMYFLSAGDIEDSDCDLSIYKALKMFGEKLKNQANELQSLVVLFSENDLLSEGVYEKALWDRLQELHCLDLDRGVKWDRNSESDPLSPHFSMSIAGHSFFVVGMHANASRPARRTPFPVMVFNSHEQFEKLRESGKYSKLQKTIRDRDIQYAGSINPMVTNFGDASEALQYSGRMLPQNWVCPFQP